MMAALSWGFLILSPISFLGILYITYKKVEGNILYRLLLGALLGGITAFIFFFISAFIGMSFH